MKLKAPQPVELARKYVHQCDPAISGQGGHKATFRVAVALVRRFGLCETDALALMLVWNRTCQPPWSEAELRHKIASALHSCRPGVLAHWPPSEPNSRSASDEAATLHLSVPDSAPKSSANLNGWIALKASANLRRPTRARCSERAA